MIGWKNLNRRKNMGSRDPKGHPQTNVNKASCLKKSACETGESSSRLDSSDGRIECNGQDASPSLSSSLSTASRSTLSSAAPSNRQPSRHEISAAVEASSNQSRGAQRGRVSSRSFPSCTSETYSVSGSKSVKFGTTEIREYNRAVSDNPSCSSGPPIGIGWEYRESRKVNVSQYEQQRGNRKHQLDIVLTRKQREELLLEWGVPLQAIAEGTRSALRTKNQRKQTVVNAGKIAKLEEALERASRSFKRALLLRRGTSSRVQELQEQADRAAIALAAMKDQCRRVEDGCTTTAASSAVGSSIRVEVEPEVDIFEKLDMRVRVSTVASTAPADAMMQRFSGITFSNEIVKAFDDSMTIGATTLGNNSCTQSMEEVEKFYRELELELFGEEAELPSMVGQTLEVPVIGASHDANNSFDCTCTGQSCNDYYYNCSQTCSTNEVSNTITSSHCPESQMGLKHPHFRPQAQSYAPDYCSHSPRYWRDGHDVTPDIGGIAQERSAETEGFGSSQNHFQTLAPRFPPCDYSPDQRFSDLQSSSDRSVRRSSSFELADPRRRQPSCSPFPKSGSSTRDCYSFRASPLRIVNGGGDVDRDTKGKVPLVPHSNGGQMRYYANCHQVSSQHQDCFDEPQIRHMPLHGHLSPNQWMGECDAPPSYMNGSVTIVEDNHYDVPVFTGQR